MKWSELSPHERDALVAEKVFDQTNFEHGEIEETSCGDPACSRCDEIGTWGDDIFGDTKCIKRYSTDIAAAWQVVEKLRDKHCDICVREWDEVECYFGGDNFHIGAKADTLPLAVCIAALKTIGVEID